LRAGVNAHFGSPFLGAIFGSHFCEPFLVAILGALLAGLKGMGMHGNPYPAMDRKINKLQQSKM
jgi:hypothetical protein